MLANSAARTPRFIFRPRSAASAGGISGRTALAHRSPNAALAASAGSISGWTVLSHRNPNAVLAAAANRRHMSEFVLTWRAFLVDTLALVRGMEAQGIQSKHAEAITSTITKGLIRRKSCVQSEMIWDANLSKFKSEVQSSRVLHLEIPDANLSKFKFKSEVQSSQEYHFSLLQQPTEKLQGDIDLLYWRIQKQIAETTDRTTKLIAETTDRISKQIAETTDRTTKQIEETTDRISKQIAETTDRTTKQIEETTDRISKQIAETTDRTAKQIEETTDRISKQIVEFTDRITKLDWEVNALRAQLPVEIHGLRAQLETAKYDVIEYCIRTVVSISAVTLVVLRIGL